MLTSSHKRCADDEIVAIGGKSLFADAVHARTALKDSGRNESDSEVRSRTGPARQNFELNLFCIKSGDVPTLKSNGGVESCQQAANTRNRTIMLGCRRASREGAFLFGPLIV